MDQRYRCRQEFLTRVAQHPAGLVVEVDDAVPLRIDDEDGVVGMFENLPESLFAQSQGLLRKLALGDVNNKGARVSDLSLLIELGCCRKQDIDDVPAFLDHSILSVLRDTSLEESGKLDLQRPSP